MISTLPYTLVPQLNFIFDSRPCPLCQSSHSFISSLVSSWTSCLSPVAFLPSAFSCLIFPSPSPDYPSYPLPSLFAFSVYPASPSNASSSVRVGHLCSLWWFRQMACIFSDVPKAGACSPLLLLLQVCGMDQLGIQSMRKSTQSSQRV